MHGHPARVIPALLFAVGWIGYFALLTATDSDPVLLMLFPVSLLVLGGILSWIIARRIK